jgi:hypothetical protein
LPGVHVLLGSVPNVNYNNLLPHDRYKFMIFEIDGFYRIEDGDDWWPAVMRAQAHWKGTTDPTQVFYKYKGFSLQFGPREYKFSDSIQLIRGMSLIGSGGSKEFAGTILSFPVGKHGIICTDLQTAPSDMLGQGSRSIIERFRIQGGYQIDRPDSDRTISHGIEVDDASTIRDCYIAGFTGNGIYVRAYTHTTPQVFQCSANGTSGYVEPADLENANTSTVTDGTVTWTYKGQCEIWGPGTYNVGKIVIPTIYNRTGYLYQCTQSGTSPGPEPHWSTNIGDITQDGPIQWTCLGKDESWKPTQHFDNSATIMTNRSSNANDWQVQNCLIQNCGGDISHFVCRGLVIHRPYARVI